MRLYELVLEPLTAFGTPLAGDTIFGQFCWQLYYQPELAAKPLPELLELYPSRPFAVFSSAWPRLETPAGVNYALPRPALPRQFWDVEGSSQPEGECRERLQKRPAKEFKKKRWLWVGPEFQIDLRQMASDTELWEAFLGQLPIDSYWYRELYKIEADFRKIILQQSQPHNTINRQWGRTGKGAFAPYWTEVIFFSPTLRLALFVVLDEAMIGIESVVQGLRQIGQTGYGRDASNGLGRFAIVHYRELSLPELAPNHALLTLGPCVPEPYRQAFYQPLVRFGKHGDRLAVGGNPFKAPVVMAAPGAVFLPQEAEARSRPWWGRAVTGVSKQEAKTVVQGYTPYVTLALEVPHA